jgi:protein-S-isoprenylcysteine O-methyltransferase Ste14
MKTTITFLAALGATVLWLALAVLGWGGLHAFIANPARDALVIVTFLLLVASSFTKGNLSRGEEEDRGNRWVLLPFFAGGILIGWLPAYSDRIGWLTVGGEVVRGCGVALFAIGGFLRLAPVFTLGRRFSGLVAIQKDHQLVTEGLYRKIRNPSYLGMLIMLVGWSLAFRSIAGLVLTALFLPPLIARMHSEEALLARHFGAEYEAYRARTWRLVPHVY